MKAERVRRGGKHEARERGIEIEPKEKEPPQNAWEFLAKERDGFDLACRMINIARMDDRTKILMGCA